MSVSFQTDRLLPWRTACENVELGLQILDKPKDETGTVQAGFGRPNITLVGGLATENGTWGAFDGVVRDPTPVVKGAASISQRTGRFRSPPSTAPSRTVRTARIGEADRSGVKPMSRMNSHATTSVTPSSAARRMVPRDPASDWRMQWRRQTARPRFLQCVQVPRRRWLPWSLAGSDPCRDPRRALPAPAGEPAQ